MRVLAIVFVASLFFPVVFAVNQKDSLGNVAFPGPISISIDSLVINRNNPAVIYAISRKGGLFKSADSGETWAFSSSGIPHPITTIVIDPSDSRSLYAGTQGGIYRSLDAGTTWESLSLKKLVFGIVIQEAAPPTIYASTDRGLFKSNDAGSTWDEIGKNVDAFIRPLAADPAGHSMMYASVGRPEDVIRSILDDLLACKKRLCEYEGDGLYGSKDHGEHWQKLSRIRVSVLSFVLGSPKTMYAGADEILKSLDGGETWLAKSSGIPKSGIRSLVIDQRNPEILYAASNYSSGGQLSLYNWAISRVFKSSDGGETWKKVSDFPVNCVVIDPNNSQILYAATPGGGVLKSIDAGNKWKPSNSGLVADSLR